jgi:hypothetical protein
VLIVAPCGFHIGRAKEELHLLARNEGWEEMEAVARQVAGEGDEEPTANRDHI